MTEKGEGHSGQLREIKQVQRHRGVKAMTSKAAASGRAKLKGEAGWVVLKHLNPVLQAKLGSGVGGRHGCF